MACQSVTPWKDAPVAPTSERSSAVGGSTVICFSSSGRLVKYSRHERPHGSLPAFAWDDVVLQRNPYPPHYGETFAFSAFLYPQPHRFALRLPTLFGKTLGLPRSTYITEWVRSALFAGSVGCPREAIAKCLYPLQCLLAQAYQHLRLVRRNDVYQAFTSVDQCHSL